MPSPVVAVAGILEADDVSDPTIEFSDGLASAEELPSVEELAPTSAAKRMVVEQARAHLVEQLSVDEETADALMRWGRSALDVSVIRLLRTRPSE